MYETSTDSLIDEIRDRDSTIEDLEGEVSELKHEIDMYESEYVHEDDVLNVASDHGWVDPDYIEPEVYGWVSGHELSVYLDSIRDAAQSFESCRCQSCYEDLISAIDNAENQLP